MISIEDMFYVKNNIEKSNIELMKKLKLNYQENLSKFKHLKEKIRKINDDYIEYLKNTDKSYIR